MRQRTRRIASITGVTILASVGVCLLLVLLGSDARSVSLALGGVARSGAPGSAGRQATEVTSGTITIEKETNPTDDSPEFAFTTTYPDSFSLAHGEYVTTSVAPGSYRITETVLNGWELTEIACAVIGNSVFTESLETASVEIDVAESDAVTCTFSNSAYSLVIDKSGELADGGRVVTYSFGITNTGAVSLTKHQIIDSVLDDITNEPEHRDDLPYYQSTCDNPPVLDPRDACAITVAYTIASHHPFTLENTVTATYTTTRGTVVYAYDSHSVRLLEPVLTIVKEGPELVRLGDTVVYTFTVSNAGDHSDGPNSPIGNVEVTDTDAEPVNFVSGDDNQDDLLQVGETWIFTATHTPWATGVWTNTATASGTAPHGAPIEATDTHAVVVYDPSISVTKEGPDTAGVGETVVYTVTVENETEPEEAPPLQLQSVIEDDPYLDLTDTAFLAGCNELEYRRSCSFTYTYQLPTTALEAFTNTVQARYHVHELPTEVITDAASHTVQLFGPSLDVHKTGPDQAVVGEDVSYTVVITNTSCEETPDLAFETIDDSLKGDLTDDENIVTTTCTPTLATGSRCQIVYTYTVQAKEPSPLVNTVTVTAYPEGFTGRVETTASHETTILRQIRLPLVLRNHPPIWTPSTGLPAGVEVRTLAVCDSDPDILYAGFGVAGVGIYRSQDGGRSWSRVDHYDSKVFDIAIAPGGCDVVYAAGWDRGMMKAVDGTSWNAMPIGLDGSFVYSVAVDPHDNNVIYAGTADRGVFASSDGGATWGPWGLSGLTVPDLTFGSDGQALYAATWGQGVHQRPLSGTQWLDWHPVDPGIEPGHREIYGVAVDPQDPAVLFVASASGRLYRTGDAAGSWTPVFSDAPRVFGAAVDPVDSQTIYAVTGHGVYRSVHGGIFGSWHRWSAGLGTLGARSIAVGPHPADTVHIGTADGAWRRLR